MVMGSPRVSVVLPVRDGGKFLAEAVESVLSQSLSDFELIIVDDGSRDGTWQIIESFRDSRIVAFSREKRGLSASLNFGIRIARAEFIARMDADDVCLPDRLKIQVAELHKRTDTVALAGRAIVIDELGRETGRVCSPRECHEDVMRGFLRLRGDTLVHPTVMFRKSALLAVGGYNERFRASQDVDLWLRLAAIGRLSSVPEVVLKFRQHPYSTSSTRHEDQLTFGMAARVCYWIREAGLHDPSTASEEVWEGFISRVENELRHFGVYDSYALRLELRDSIRQNSLWERPWRLAWLCARDPNRLHALLSRRRYLRALDCLLAYYVSYSRSP